LLHSSVCLDELLAVIKMPGTELFDMEKFKKDGYIIIDDFLSDDEIASLMSECHKLVDEMDPTQHRSIFSTTNYQNLKDDYFLTSADKIRFFFEEDAFDKEGKLIVDKHLALNKMGHAMHELNPVFKKVSTSPKVKELVNCLSLVNPVIAQSMYIFKQPSIGGRVFTHQDATYLHTNPCTGLYGLWFALEDCTEQTDVSTSFPALTMRVYGEAEDRCVALSLTVE
jgi:phytanoyl-CoA hydroxylase